MSARQSKFRSAAQPQAKDRGEKQAVVASSPPRRAVPARAAFSPSLVSIGDDRTTTGLSFWLADRRTRKRKEGIALFLFLAVRMFARREPKRPTFNLSERGCGTMLVSCRFTSSIATIAGKTAKFWFHLRTGRGPDVRIAVRRNWRRNFHCLPPARVTAATAHIRAGVGRDHPVAVVVWDRTAVGKTDSKLYFMSCPKLV